MIEVLNKFTLEKEPAHVGSLEDSNAIEFNVTAEKRNGFTIFGISIDNVKKEGYLTQLFPYESLLIDNIYSCKRRTAKQELLMYDALKEKLPCIVDKYNEKYKNRKITIEELEKLFFDKEERYQWNNI